MTQHIKYPEEVRMEAIERALKRTDYPYNKRLCDMAVAAMAWAEQIYEIVYEPSRA